jgi:hypothetical protein
MGEVWFSARLPARTTQNATKRNPRKKTEMRLRIILS